MQTRAGEPSRSLKLASGQSVGLATFGAADGVPVLALHGAPACRLMFDVAHQAARDAGLTLYCPDRPGYGLTPSDGGGSLAARTDFHVELANALGLEQFLVLAISGGAPYGAALAARCPDRVAGLALVSPMGPIVDFLAEQERSGGGVDAADGAMHVPMAQRWFFTKLARRPRLLAGFARAVAFAFHRAPKMSARVFGVLAGEPDRSILKQDEVATSFMGMTREALAPGVLGGTSDLVNFSRSWEIDWARISAPCVLWQGTRDRIVPRPVAFWLGQKISGCQIKRLRGCGHFWVYDHVDDVFRELTRISRLVD